MFNFFLCKLTDNFTRSADHKSPGWNRFAGRDESSRTDEGKFTDGGPVEYDGSHADQSVIHDGAPMQDGVVADGDMVTDGEGMTAVNVQCGVILNIGLFADGDAGHIAADNGVGPEARTGADLDIPDNLCPRGNIDIPGNFGSYSLIRKSHIAFHLIFYFHYTILAKSAESYLQKKGFCPTIPKCIARFVLKGLNRVRDEEGSGLVIRGTGVDIAENNRFQEMLEKGQDGFFLRVFTEAEREYCEKFRTARIKAEHYAARFAAKEAFLKALGTGLRDTNFHEMEVKNDMLGAPYLEVGGKAALLLQKKGIQKLHLSMSHSDQYSIAMVIAEGEGDCECGS